MVECYRRIKFKAGAEEERREKRQEGCGWRKV